jgi:hypothetical protein
MRYSELDGVIYRGDVVPQLGSVRYAEKLVGGKWVPAGDGGLKTKSFGAPMTEKEAREFQGQGWPEESC